MRHPLSKVLRWMDGGFTHHTYDSPIGDFLIDDLRENLSTEENVCAMALVGPTIIPQHLTYSFF